MWNKNINKQWIHFGSLNFLGVNDFTTIKDFATWESSTVHVFSGVTGEEGAPPRLSTGKFLATNREKRGKEKR